MKVGVTSAAVEYSVAVTVLSVPVAVAGFHFADLVDRVLGNLLTQVTAVAMLFGG